MSLADACLVKMSELHAEHHVFTLDADFSIYRKHGRDSIKLICLPSDSLTTVMSAGVNPNTIERG